MLVRIKTYFFLLVPLYFLACSTTPEKASETLPSWPEPPARARIVMINSFASAAELGIGKGFFSWLGNVFFGEEESRLIRPMAVVVDENNRIYVADPDAKGVHLFDKAKDEYRLLHLSDNRPLLSPVAMVSMGQTLLVADSKLAAIFQFRPGDKYLSELTLSEKLEQPTGMVWDEANNELYITDTAKHKVLVFNEHGKKIQEIGKRGNGHGEFNFPTMIWQTNKGELLVSDSLNFRVQVFDQLGKYSAQFGELGDGSGYQSRPKGVASDASGNIYVVDALFSNVQVYSRLGKYLMHFGERGQKKGQFWLPAGIFIDKQQKLYVADSHNNRVQIFKLETVQ